MTSAIDHIAVVLPAYNEEKDLPILLNRLDAALSRLPWPYHIVVVDDGSSDGTAAIAEAASTAIPIHLVRHPRNLGLGRAIQTGLSEGRKFGGVVVTMDADNSHDPAYIADMVATLENEKADVVICSRYQKGSRVVGLSSFRRLLSFGCFLTMKALLPYARVRDYSTGFRAYDSAIISRLVHCYGDKLVEQSGFACMLELIAKLRTVGASVREIPYTLRYDQKLGASKLRLFKTLKQYWAVVSRFAWSPVHFTEVPERAPLPHPAKLQTVKP